MNDQSMAEFGSIWDALGDRQTDEGTRSRLYDRAIAIARQLDNPILEMNVFKRRAQEQLSSVSGYSRGGADGAVKDFEAARALCSDDEERAWLASDIALALMQSAGGDPVARVEKAISMSNEALEYFGRSAHPQEWAMIATNMSLMYVDREQGDSIQNAEVAVALTTDALRIRKRDLNEADWAFSTFNLALALSRLGNRRAEARLDVGDTFERAARLYSEAGNAFLMLGQTVRFGRAESNRATVLRDQAKWSMQHRQNQIAMSSSTLDASDVEMMILLADALVSNPSFAGFSEPPHWALDIQGSFVPNVDEEELLHEAEDAALRALQLTSAGADRADTESCLAAIKRLLRRPDNDVASHLTQALANLEGYNVPRKQLGIATELGGIAASMEDWTVASSAYKLAMDAWAELYDFRTLTKEREKNFRWQSKLVEWAAYCLARDGRASEAVEILENGRVRWLVKQVIQDDADVDQDEQFGSQAPGRVIDARLADNPTDDIKGISDEGEESEQVVQASPSMDSQSMRLVDPKVIASASRADRPLVYIVSTAAGTITLYVVPDEPALDVEVLCSSTVTSANFLMCLMQFREDGLAGLLGGAGQLDDTLHRVQALLGQSFGAELSNRLSRDGIHDVAIVPVGILGALPIGASLTSREDETDGAVDPAYLSDVANITTAPSCTVLTALERRVKRCRDAEVAFFGVGNPEQTAEGRSLRWAAAEVRAVAALYGEDAVVKLGDSADRASFVQWSRPATHIHLACHGVSDQNDPISSSLSMVDGAITASELASAKLLNCRVVVASACESGRSGFLGSANEAIGLTNAFIAGGAAAVVSSLWLVDDLATALLMVRFHENLQAVEKYGWVAGAPARALSEAQEWLRTLQESQIIEYVGSLSINDVELATYLHRMRLLESLRRRRSEREICPFRAPKFWAPFIVVGM